MCQAQQLAARHHIAGGVVRRADKYQLDAGIDARQHCSYIQLEAVRSQGHVDHARALYTRGYRIHAVGGRADQNIVLTGTAEHAQQQVYGFIAAATDQQLRRIDTIERCHTLHQGRRLRLWITIETGL